MKTPWSVWPDTAPTPTNCTCGLLVAVVTRVADAFLRLPTPVAGYRTTSRPTPFASNERVYVDTATRPLYAATAGKTSSWADPSRTGACHWTPFPLVATNTSPLVLTDWPDAS